MNPHPAGVTVVSGANDYRNNFGGTSSATPLAAGVAPLVLSANPDLTFVQTRKILRNTAVKIDPNNVDPIGQWLDEDNNPSNISGKQPVFSQWFGHGRIDANAAVKAAVEMKPKKPREKTMYRYSVKFVCGSSGGGPVAPGSYFTAINIHNPTDRKIRFRKKVAIALPGERPGHVSMFTFNSLGPDEALEIDCADIYHRVGLPGGCFLKGFVVIQSLVELDVVAVYSAAGADEHVETLDIEHVAPRITKPEKPPKEPPHRLPDLVPLPAFPPPPPNAPGQLPQNFCLSTVGGHRADAVRIIVHNQGDGDAPESVTEVVFENNPPIQVNTPAIAAGGEAIVEVKIPKGCFVGESSCAFDITVNVTSAFDESDETNNKTSGFCPGIVL
jgi:hypothetical protein